MRLSVFRYVETSDEGHVHDERGDETVAYSGRCLQNESTQQRDPG